MTRKICSLFYYCYVPYLLDQTLQLQVTAEGGHYMKRRYFLEPSVREGY